MEWLWRIDDPYSQKLQVVSPGEKRLLILDGHSSHVGEECIDFCESQCGFVLSSSTLDATSAAA